MTMLGGLIGGVITIVILLFVVNDPLVLWIFVVGLIVGRSLE